MTQTTPYPYHWVKGMKEWNDNMMNRISKLVVTPTEHAFLIDAGVRPEEMIIDKPIKVNPDDN